MQEDIHILAEFIDMRPEDNWKTWDDIEAEEIGCKYSNILKNFIFSQSEIEVDVQIGEEEHNCVADSFVIKRNGILFTPQIEGIKKTNGLTILDRSELISLLGKGLIAVEIVLADKERLIINHCYKNKKNWLPSQYYNALPVERIHIEKSHKNLSDEYSVRLPCKPGDTVFFIDRKDCRDCEKYTSCEDFLANKLCRFELVECEVETLMYIVDKNESIVVINEQYEIYDPASIKMKRADAESLWKHLLTQKCFKCDCTLNKENDKCPWRNDGSYCINMNEKMTSLIINESCEISDFSSIRIIEEKNN